MFVLAGRRVAVIEPISGCATIGYRGPIGPVEWWEEEEMQAIFWFWFVFGAVAGMAALPHLQRIAARARRTLAELDQPKQPSSGS